MNKSSLDRKQFAVIGFTGAGKSTYVKALGCAATGKGSEYEIVDGEKYIQSLVPESGSSPGGTVPGTHAYVAFRKKNKANCEFGFRDYAGEDLVDSNGHLTRLYAENFSNKIGVLILINPFVQKKEDIEDRYCASKYQPIIEFLAENSNIRKVLLVRTASDFYQVMDVDQRRKFDSFLEEVKNRFEKANRDKFETGVYTISCQGEANQLLRPFEALIQKIDFDSHVSKEDKCEQGAEKLPCDEQRHEKKWPWFVALAVLLCVGIFYVLPSCSRQGGEIQWSPTETVEQGECGKNEGAHAESDGQVVENTVTKRLCAQCQSVLDDAEDGTLCAECQRKQEEERRKKEEEESRKKRINEFSEELDRCPSVVDRIKCLNEVSDEIPAVHLVRYAEDVSDKVSEEYRGILARMRDFRLSLEEVIREDRDKMAGAVEYDKTNVDGMFSIFKELSATLCKTRNDTLKQNDWYCFIAESFKNKQLCDRCAECYQQKYEISDVSIKVENNPYRWVTVALSFFQYSGDVGKYEIRELVKKTDVVKKKKSCDWTSVWTDNVVCVGNPWRCCGMKFRFKGNNMGPGQAFHSAAKVLNDEVASYDADGLGRIEDELEFGGDEKKGAVKLRYRITFRRLNPEVKSPYSLEGVVK